MIPNEQRGKEIERESALFVSEIEKSHCPMCGCRSIQSFAMRWDGQWYTTIYYCLLCLYGGDKKRFKNNKFVMRNRGGK